MNTQINPFTTTMPALEKVTDKYKFISTAQFIEDLTGLGYKLEATSAPRKGLGLHSMYFSHHNLPKIDGLDLRLLATNSHNGTSAFRLYLSVGVGVCANILVAFLPELANRARIVHRGYAVEKVEKALEVVNGHITQLIESMNTMQVKSVNEVLISKFITEAAKLRNAKPYLLKELTVCKHAPQAENTAWNIFNRVQESLVKGGYRTVEIDELTGLTQIGKKAREIHNVREKVQLNYKLWQLAVEILVKENLQFTIEAEKSTIAA